MGAVVCNNSGALLEASVKRLCALWPSNISELVAAAYGIEVAIFLGYSYIHLEGDILNVMNCINGKPTGCSPFFLLLDRLYHLILSLFGFYSSVVRRSGNTAAHMVARWNSGSVRETIYMYPFPQSFVTLILLDLI